MRPYYKNKPIYKVSSLLKVLCIDQECLDSLLVSPRKYHEKIIEKNKKKRKIYKAIGKLRSAQKKINKHIFSNVCFPKYVHGAVKGKSAKTNAMQHVDAKILIQEDIKNFYPNCTEDVVFNVWKRFFHFSLEVSEILTALTTYKGILPQGASTSSYLANLVFFENEYKLVKKISEMNGVYTRYLDDISVSFPEKISTKTKSKVVSCIVNTLNRYELPLNRKKHLICNSGDRKIITGVNCCGNYISAGRSRKENIKAMIYNLNTELRKGCPDKNKLLKDINKIEGHISHYQSISSFCSPKFHRYKDSLLDLKNKIINI